MGSKIRISSSLPSVGASPRDEPEGFRPFRGGLVAKWAGCRNFRIERRYWRSGVRADKSVLPLNLPILF
jgi:hypothetical protein